MQIPRAMAVECECLGCLQQSSVGPYPIPQLLCPQTSDPLQSESESQSPFPSPQG